MRTSRYLVLVLLVVTALTLSACAVSPSALAGIGGLIASQKGLAQAQATATPAADTTAAPTTAAPAAATANAPAIADLQAALQAVYEQVSPSVVSIRTIMSAADQTGQSPFGQDGQGDQGNAPTAEALGSGWVWDDQGHIITNNHVVDGATSVTVIFSDGTSLKAEVVGRDPESEVAVVKVDPTKVSLKPVTLGDSTQAKVGEFVVAIGNPFGLETSMTFGIVSALGRSLPVGNSMGMMGGSGSYTIPDIIQTDAPVNPGNSGGALLDLQGRLIGIPTAIESSTQSSAGVGFAVPSVIVKKVVPEIIASGTVKHPYIGISGTTLTSELATAMNLKESQRGVLVVNVTSGGPADKAGLRGSTKQVDIEGQQAQVGGDVITAVNGQPVKDFEDVTTWLARNAKVGDTIELTVLRDGAEQKLSVTLAARPGQQGQQATEQSQPQQGQGQQGQQQQPSTARGWLGISGMTLSTDVANAMNLAQGQQGVEVVNVQSGSPADKAGLQGSTGTTTVNGQDVPTGGDVITAVNGQAVMAMEDLAQTIGNMKPGDVVTLSILRNGQQSDVQVTLGDRSAMMQQGQNQQGQNQQGQGQQEQPTPQPAPQSNARGWLGITGMTLNADVANAMKLDQAQQGVEVVNVQSGSPADKAGLKGSTGTTTVNGQDLPTGGDVITAVNGQAVTAMEDLAQTIGNMKPGDAVTLSILRNGEKSDVQVTLGDRTGMMMGQGQQNRQGQGQNQQGQGQQQQPTPQPAPQSNARGWLGITGMTLNADVANAMKLNQGQQGVLVVDVMNGSPADKAGLKGGTMSTTINGQDVQIGGDVITAVDGKAVTAMEDLAQIIGGKKANDQATLSLLRNGQKTDVQVTLGERPASMQ
jgi:serine protease Do